eukprot:Lankesteria_metandrocarpae@DN5134_c0_g1_i2.p1
MTSSRGRSSSKHLQASRYTSVSTGSTSKHSTKHIAKYTKSVSKDPDTAHHKRLDSSRHQVLDAPKTRRVPAKIVVQNSSRQLSSANNSEPRLHNRSVGSQHHQSYPQQQQQQPRSSRRQRGGDSYYYSSSSGHVSTIRRVSKSREASSIGPAAVNCTTQQRHPLSSSKLKAVKKLNCKDDSNKVFSKSNSATGNMMSDAYGGCGGRVTPPKTPHQQSSSGLTSSSAVSGTTGCTGTGNRNGRVQPPSEEDKHRALSYKEIGNECYKMSFYEAAVENYSLAIKFDPTEPTYRTNRALAYMKQKRWADLTADSESAIMLNPVFFKAHYLLGVGLQMTGRVDEAIEKLKQAQRLAPEKKHSLDCDRAIRTAKKKKWELYTEQKQKDLENLKQILEHNGSSDAPLDEKSIYQLRELVADAVTQLQPKPVPDYLCCRISMCLLSDPVTTPSGLTYERELLLKHIQRNGPFDPLTRETCNANDVRSCVCIQQAVEEFLDDNPGCAEDTYN